MTLLLEKQNRQSNRRNIKCYNCGEKGHIRLYCRNKRRENNQNDRMNNERNYRRDDNRNFDNTRNYRRDNERNKNERSVRFFNRYDNYSDEESEYEKECYVKLD
jgi:hypothetical protein